MQLQLVKCGNATLVFVRVCVWQFIKKKSQPAVCACVRAPVPSLQTGLRNGRQPRSVGSMARGRSGAPSGVFAHDEEVVRYGPQLVGDSVPLIVTAENQAGLQLHLKSTFCSLFSAAACSRRS